ncbi:MAG: hypothetical protein RLZZ272_783 [Actinomycetota bacterium]
MTTTDAVRENLTREEAIARRDLLEVERTRVHLELAADAETFRSTATVTFTVRGSGSTFLDCTAVEVHRVVLDGEDLGTAGVSATRVALPELAPGRHEVTVEATMAHRHEGEGLHRFVDPSDGLVYLHSQFEPFDAHLVFACFDQPDLRTVLELSVDAPEGWVVVSNEPATERPAEGTAGRWAFAPTPPIPTYITAVVAGAYASVHDRHVRPDGRATELGLHVRRSLAEHLDHEEWFALTRAGLDWFEGAFGMPYPFTKYDQLLVPEFSAGAMENPGCVTFSENYVFRSRVTDALRERRAETLLHEMAHMWFGDLVTMRWWDDLWLNESFATFMSVLCQTSATRWHDAWVTFVDAEKAWAKLQDQLPSTHPIADEMPDVESVHQNFDGITYAKGASVLRQLVAWVGQDAFLAGCRAYFAEHAWSNTELTDFLGALEGASGRELAGWADEWLRTTGINRLGLELTTDDEGRITAATLVQEDPAPAWRSEPRPPVLRRHRLAIGGYERDGAVLRRTTRIELDAVGERTDVPELVGLVRPPVLVVNDDDLTYTKVRVDDVTLATIEHELAAIVEPMARALLWGDAWDLVRDGELAASRFVTLITTNLRADEPIGVLQRLLQRGHGAVERYAAEANRPALRVRLLAHARDLLATAEGGSDVQLALVRHWAALADADAADLDRLAGLLEGRDVPAGLSVDTDLRWALLGALARAGRVGEDAIVVELARDDTDLGRRSAAYARAARPLLAAKETAWELLMDPELPLATSRQVWAGLAQLDQAEVLAPFTERYFTTLPRVWRERSLDWSIEWSAGTFPHWAAGPGLVERVDAVLADAGLARPLRRVLLEQRDTLMRTLAARDRDARDG